MAGYYQSHRHKLNAMLKFLTVVVPYSLSWRDEYWHVVELAVTSLLGFWSWDRRPDKERVT